MKNGINWFIALIILGVLFYLGRCTYPVLSISSTTPPIKTYHFNGATDSLVNYIREQVAKDTTLHLKTDTYSSGKDRFYEMYLDQSKPKAEFVFKCDSEADSSKLMLTGAINLENNTGGYGIKAEGVAPLIKKFDTIFSSLAASQH